MNSLKKTARITGVLYLLLIVFAPFSMLYVPSVLVVPGDAAATAANITASEGLFRLSIVSDSIVFLIEIILVVMLYVLLKQVNKTLSLTAAFSRLGMTIVQGVNLINHFIVLLLLSGSGFLAAFEPAQINALSLLFLQAHEVVAHLWGLFFALHLLLLGYLVYKSGYIPAWLGGVLLVASLCYFIQGFGNIMLPKAGEVFEVIGFVSIIELAFPLYLVIKGVKQEPTAPSSSG